MTAPRIIINPQSIKDVTDKLSGIKNGIGKVAAGAINDLVKSGRTQVARQVTAQVVLKYGRVLKQVRVTRATPQNLEATLRVDDKNRPGLKAYGAKDTKKKGVTYRISKSEGRKRILNAFEGRGKSRGQAASADNSGMALRIFKRAGKSRKPLIDIKGPSLNRVITKNEIDLIVADTIRKSLPERVSARAALLIEKGR